MKKFLKWIGIAFVALIVIGAIASLGSNNSNTTSQKTSTMQATPIEKKEDFTVSDTKAITENGVKFITGTVKNNTNKEYKYVQIEINLYDESGAQVGSTMTNINNLEPDGTWNFKALVTEDNVKSFKVKEVIGW